MKNLIMFVVTIVVLAGLYNLVVSPFMASLKKTNVALSMKM